MENGKWRMATVGIAGCCGSFYEGCEAWLHMQLHFTAATKLITNKNASKPKKKTKENNKEKRMQSVEMRCWEGIQQILSIRFRYGFFFFSSYFFLLFVF